MGGQIMDWIGLGQQKSVAICHAFEKPVESVASQLDGHTYVIYYLVGLPGQRTNFRLALEWWCHNPKLTFGQEQAELLTLALEVLLQKRRALEEAKTAYRLAHPQSLFPPTLPPP